MKAGMTTSISSVAQKIMEGQTGKVIKQIFSSHKIGEVENV